MGKVRTSPRPSDRMTSKSKRKKSVRLMMQNYKMELDRKAKYNYVWPRTVEAAHDPFTDATGKNKMFYIIACDLYPESKIVQPSDTETDDGENSSEEDFDDDDTYGEFAQLRCESVGPLKTRLYRTQQSSKRINCSREADVDVSWRSQYNRRVQKRRPRANKTRIIDQNMILDVINTVVKRYSNLSNEIEVAHMNPAPVVERIPYPAVYIKEEPQENFDAGYDDVEDSEETNEDEEHIIQGDEYDGSDSDEDDQENDDDNDDCGGGSPDSVSIPVQMIEPISLN